MKKFLALALLLTMTFTLATCGNNNSSKNSNDTNKSKPAVDKTEQSETRTGKILIAYFTVPESDGVDAVSSASRVVVDGEIVGNTQQIARWIQQEVDGDLFAIETVKNYPGDHDTLLDFAAEEKDVNARPELASHVEKMADYDTVFIGYPIWWYDLPMPLYTFLEQYDLSGKTIIPFSTHGGSGFLKTIETIAELQPSATVIDNGLTISRDKISGSKSDVTAWLEELGILK